MVVAEFIIVAWHNTISPFRTVGTIGVYAFQYTVYLKTVIFGG